MTATVLPAPSGLPSPRSPTLSDAGMILPDDSTLRSLSPNPYAQRPPSPSSLLYTHSNLSSRTVTLASPPKGRRGPSLQVSSPPLSARSSASNLRTMSAASPVLHQHAVHHDALASSPTLRDSMAASTPDNGEARQQRRLSSSSGSVRSEDLENIKWPGFDSAANGFEDSGVDLAEQEEEQDQFSSDGTGDVDADHEGWLDGQDDGDVGDDGDDGDDGVDETYSSAALSRRAEIILANAKKRLNVMEGNLRGARHSLLVSPSSFNTTKMSAELSHHLAIARERDRKLYGGIGPIPPRQRPYNASPLSSTSSPGHSRVLSETSVPPAFSYTALTHGNSDKRASSAMGVASGAWSPADGRGNGRFPIRESKSHEVMRDPRGSAWTGIEDHDHSLRSYSRGSKSPPNTLEPLPEDDGEVSSLHRSSSTTGNLRVQMSELKGRISSLKQRAKEDNLRRRSLQSLRTPSPFTAAEIWYAGADAYKTSPIAANAGVGLKQASPTRKELYEDDEVNFPENQTAHAITSNHEGREDPRKPTQAADDGGHEYPESYYEDAEDSHLVHATSSAQDTTRYSNSTEIEHEDEYDDGQTDFMSVQDDDLEPGGESVYEDAVYDMPVTERHEDRVDAFDYEHFFLHSAMGTYSSASRRSSSGSADSVETTRPVTAVLAPQTVDDSIKRISLHQRNASVDSVSTMATFATAAEDQSDDEDEDPIGMDSFAPHVLPSHRAPSAANRSDSAINMRAYNGNISPSAVQETSRESSPAGDIVEALRTSKIFSALVETSSEAEPSLALTEGDKQLIYSVAASLQQVCASLQRRSGDQFQRQEWRGRLDAALKVLNGEELDNEVF